MGMCKGCGEVFNTNDMFDGFCKDCATDEIKEKVLHKINTERKDEQTSWNNFLAIIRITVITFLTFIILLSIAINISSEYKFYAFVSAFVPTLYIYQIAYNKIRFEKSLKDAIKSAENFFIEKKVMFLIIAFSLLLIVLTAINKNTN